MACPLDALDWSRSAEIYAETTEQALIGAQLCSTWNKVDGCTCEDLTHPVL